MEVIDPEKKQIQAKNTEIAELIKQLQELIRTQCFVINSIKDHKALILALLELDNLVEMEDVKSAIVEQIQELIIDQARNKTKLGGDVLHTVIYGPPGVGKTKLGTILAKLWLSLGLVKPPITKPTEKTGQLAEKLKEAIYLSRIIDLKNTVIAHQNRLKRVHDLALKEKETISRLRRRVIRLRPTKHEDDNADREWEEVFRESRQIRYAIDDVIKDTTLDPKDVEEMESSDSVKPVSDVSPPKPVTDTEKSNKDKDTESELPIVIVSREDFVGEYQGHSATKTLTILKANIGKILFIDEAYSLINGDRDNFGMEALTVLNRFMSEHPDEIIIIFAGYEELMQKTIFAAQPGLKRRCNRVFKIKGYSAKALTGIFERQLHEKGWVLDPDFNVEDFFKTNLERFTCYGGDTKKLTKYISSVYSKIKFTEAYKSLIDGSAVSLDNIINEKIVKKALEILINNNAEKHEDENNAHMSMYL